MGVDLVNLVTSLRGWPEATLEEMAIFLYNKGGPSLLAQGDLPAVPRQAGDCQEVGIYRGLSGTEGGHPVLCLVLLEQSNLTRNFQSIKMEVDRS